MKLRDRQKLANRRRGREKPPEPPPPTKGEKAAFGVPLVHMVPRVIKKSADVVMTGRGNPGIVTERFRRLKTLLIDPDRRQVLIVTSTAPGDGKSFVSINLALAFASDEHSDKRTLLIDGDMRRPTLQRLLDPAPSFGLVDVLEGRVDVEHALVQIKDTQLEILPAGKPSIRSVELIESSRCADLIESLREQYANIIIDTPPSAPFTDADALARHGSGILFVARQGHTQNRHYTRTVAGLTGAPILGVVLNGTTFSLADRAGYHSRYYRDYYRAESPE